MKTNCITELLPERAVARAKYLDDFFQQHKRPIGPLHGLPVSVKEHIGMKDLGLNAGFVSWWEHKAEDDANVLKILWDAGAVFYARTTEPQTLMQLETLSNLYGETVNPYNRKLTSGGSSGGEGALISLRGSCLGLGSDIGGSVRSPAANCGIYSLHPTSYRVPMDGCAATMLAEEQIIAVIGPMSTSLQGLKLFMRTILAAKPWLVEPSVVPLPWREQHDFLQISRGGKLKVGILWNDNVVRPHPPIFRALTEVADKLRATGKFDVVDWNPYKHDEAWKIIASLYFCDGGREETIAIESSGEPWLPLSEWILKENPYVRRLSVEALWHWTARREAYRRAYAKLWNESGSMGGSNQLDSTGEEIIRLVDVILCPAGPGAAPPLGHSKYWGYTSQWNLLDYPAVVFPVSKVDKQIDVKQERYIPRNWDDHLNYNLCEYDGDCRAMCKLTLIRRSRTLPWSPRILAAGGAEVRR